MHDISGDKGYPGLPGLPGPIGPVGVSIFSNAYRKSPNCRCIFKNFRSLLLYTQLKQHCY